MIVDIGLDKKGGDGGVRLVVELMFGGKIDRLARGLYLLNHWNFSDMVGVKLNNYPAFEVEGLYCYGVCDYPIQLIEKFPYLDESERKFVVSFVRIRKSEQPSEGGWRWHKWGDYIGDKNSQYEYLYHEEDIEEVYTFHIYEVIE